jgi:hypothetical protein
MIHSHWRSFASRFSTRVFSILKRTLLDRKRLQVNSTPIKSSDRKLAGWGVASARGARGRKPCRWRGLLRMLGEMRDVGCARRGEGDG